MRSPMWELHPVLSQNITVRGVRIDTNGPNNDGCDPESCRNVLIEKVIFNTGDDCIAIKSGRNADGRRIGVPSENIVIRDCQMVGGHGGVSLGLRGLGRHPRNVYVRDCQMGSPNLNRALRLKSNSWRGGYITDIVFRDVQIDQVANDIMAGDARLWRRQWRAVQAEDGPRPGWKMSPARRPGAPSTLPAIPGQSDRRGRYPQLRLRSRRRSGLLSPAPKSGRRTSRSTARPWQLIDGVTSEEVAKHHAAGAGQRSEGNPRCACIGKRDCARAYAASNADGRQITAPQPGLSLRSFCFSAIHIVRARQSVPGSRSEPSAPSSRHGFPRPRRDAPRRA